MNITHHSGRFGVTGSCHEVKLSPAASILIDCGLLQGAEASEDPTHDPGHGTRDLKAKTFDRPSGSGSSSFIKFPISPIKAVILTHIHIDHCGRLPYLLGAGYRGKIYCSEASALLLPLVLEDALKLGITRDEGLIRSFLTALKKHLVPLPYGEWSELGSWEGATAKVRLQQAGHILGSAVVELDVDNAVQGSGFKVQDDETVPSPILKTQGSSPAFQPKYPKTQNRFVFSGDLGAPDTPLLPDPVVPERADILFLESTYGDRLHEDRKNRKERLRTIIRRAVKNKGAILIPAFSIGRTQELLYELEGLISAHRDEEIAAGLAWDDLEIVVDSPMAQKITEIYADLQPLWDAEAKAVVADGRHPLSFEQMTIISSHEEHLQTVSYLRKSARPCIVIAAGGMCAGGRIVNYLKTLLEDDRTDVVFVGYQAEGTPGRDIQQQEKGGIVAIDGKNCRIRAGIHTLSGYSAHADQQNLVDFVRAIPEKPGLVRLVHGETEARQALAVKLRREVGVVVEE